MAAEWRFHLIFVKKKEKSHTKSTDLVTDLATCFSCDHPQRNCAVKFQKAGEMQTIGLGGRGVHQAFEAMF